MTVVEKQYRDLSTYYTQIMINWFFIYSFVEKFNFLIYKLFTLGLQSHCLFCKAELILKIVETHIDEWQPWDLANNECLVTIFCSSIQSIIKNKTNNKSMYGNIVGGIDLLSSNKTTARSDKLWSCSVLVCAGCNVDIKTLNIPGKRSG